MAKKERPTVLKGKTTRMHTECGTIYITINALEDKPMEILGRMGKSGGCIASHMEAIGRLATMGLQHDIPPEEVMKQLRGIRCPSPTNNGDGQILSCADAFAKALQNFMNIEDVVEDVMCPKCKKKMEKKDNTFICPGCAYEKGNLQ